MGMRSKIILLLAVVVYCLLLYFLPKDVFWITDGGNRYIQVQNLVQNGTPALIYPAEDLDPDRAYFPYSGHHFHRLGNQIHSFYPFYFPLLSVPFYKLFNAAGLYIIPMVAAIVCLILTYLIIQELKVPNLGWLSIPILAFCTPLFFYALTFWEHTLVMALVAGAFLLILRYICNSQSSLFSLILAGVLLGVSTFFREEGYVLLAAIVIGMCFSLGRGFKQKRAIGVIIIGWLLVMVPVWLWQQHLYGNLLGIHSVVYNSLMARGGSGLSDVLLGKLTNFFVYLFKFHEKISVNLLLGIPLMLPVVVGLGFGDYKDKLNLKIVILGISGIAATLLMVLLFTNQSPVLNTLNTQALISCTPFLLLIALVFRALIFHPHPGLRFLWTMSLIYIAGSCLLLNQSDMGIIWGPRHFLYLYPILVPLSLYSFRKILDACSGTVKGKIFIASATLLFVVSFLIQLHSIETLFLKKAYFEKIAAVVAETEGEVVLTDIYWLPEELARLYFSKKLMQVKSDRDLLEFVELMQEKKIPSFTYIRGRYSQVRSRTTFKKLEKKMDIEISNHFKARKLEFMELRILNCKFRD